MRSGYGRELEAVLSVTQSTYAKAADRFRSHSLLLQMHSQLLPGMSSNVLNEREVSRIMG